MSDKSYKRYKEYRANRYRYEHEQVAIPVGIIIIGALLMQYWKVVVGIIAISLGLFIFFKVRKKRRTKTTATGYANKNNQRNIKNRNKSA